MSPPRIAAVTIGQTPRPDLLEPLLGRVGADEVAEFGALDGLSGDQIRRSTGKGGAYPLTTRLRDGSRVTIDEGDLAPLVQQAIDRGEAAGAEVTLLLCAGGFAGATARGTLIRPFDAGVLQLRDMGARRLSVVVPFESQVEPARGKWTAAGFDPAPVVDDPASLDSRWIADCHAIVLDYVGHPLRDVAALRARTSAPVIDLGEAGADAVAALLAPAAS